MNVVREIERLNERELQNGVSNTKGSWHYDYTDTNWVFVGSLEKNLSEGDVICVFSQFGEIEDLNLARDEDTGESKGFSFVKFEAWESTVLAVDNMNGVELVGRTIRVDHARYEPPKKKKGEYIEASVGHAYTDPSKIEIMGEFDIHQGVEVFKRDKKNNKKHKSKKAKKTKLSNNKRSPDDAFSDVAEKRSRIAALSNAPATSWNGL